MWSLAEGPRSERAFAALLREQLGAAESAADLVVASFAAACDEAIGWDETAWACALRDTALECGLPDEELGVFSDLVSALRRQRLIVDAPVYAPPLAVGTRVLAVLEEDGQWHDAVVSAQLDVRAATPPSARRYRVVFSEFGKPQEVEESELVDVDAVVSDDDEGSEREGECEMCARSLPLTFHHLIPKETHGRFLGKALPVGVRGEPTRLFLGSYGMSICRPCHTHLHRIASNDELADSLNTPLRIASHPDVQRFVAFIGKQRVRLRA